MAPSRLSGGGGCHSPRCTIAVSFLSPAQPSRGNVTHRRIAARADDHRTFRRLRLLVGAMFALAPSASLRAQADTAKHTTRFVTVDSGVQLEVLDWGGTGRAVVLLAGGNRTAHDFDGLAPKLAREYHVFGITRRGVGASTHSISGYESDRLGDDVLAVLDSLALRTPVLAGHSRSGAELSSIGSRFPQRIAGLIYLDAAYFYAFYDPDRGNPELNILDVQRKLQQVRALARAQTIPHRQVDSLFRELLDRDVPALTKELRENWKILMDLPDADGLLPVAPSWGSGSAVDKMWQGSQKYTTLHDVPVLAIFQEQGWHGTPNAADAFQHMFPTARIVRLGPGSDHDVWQSNEAQVLAEMRTFIAALPRVQR
jgi:non-heme chloroperoxidase